MSGNETRLSSERTPTHAVISAVASREGIDETDVRPPLYEAVDPDSLDTLFRNTSGEVSFEYCGYLVTVDANCNVELSEMQTVV